MGDTFTTTNASIGGTSFTINWKPAALTFLERKMNRLHAIMREHGCSADVAEIIWQNEWEVCDDEAILCI